MAAATPGNVPTATSLLENHQTTSADFGAQCSRGGDEATRSKMSGNEEQQDLSLCTADELDHLESRLERFVQGGNKQQSGSQPSPRKNSAGSHIPKPEISPKPTGAFLISACKGAGNAMTQSLLRTSPPKTKPTSTPATTSVTKDQQDSKNVTLGDSKTLSAKASGTASMLKSTLRRMTRLSSVKDKSAERSPDEPVDPLKLTRSMVQPAAVGQRNSLLTSSLRRPRNKEDPPTSLTKQQQQTFQRSGTGGTLERRGVSRSHSVTGRKFRDRDLNVKKSRAVQTQLTRDVIADEDGDANDHEHLSTNLEFTLFLPELLGAEVDVVETHVSEPTEPADVRKNRQLTLDNMKLHREVERLKTQSTENESLKKELRSVKSKLEEEQKSRTRIEQQLDKHNEKVKMIVQSMDSVEREFESRDKKLDDYKVTVAQLQNEVDTSNEVIASLQQELEKSLAAQKVLLCQYQEAEAESRELQEFLQAEKMTLAETLKDCENDISALSSKLRQKDLEIAAVEERCSHLVRLGEQRHQEAMSMQAQLNAGQERAKDMLLAQGAEISRANIHVSELYSRLEKLIGEGSSSSSNRDEPRPAHSCDSYQGTSYEDATSDSISNADDAVANFPPAFANFPRSNSQFLVTTSSTDIYGLTSSVHSDGNSNGMSESLQNLSKAISQRQKSENGGLESFASSNGSLPSLADRIIDMQTLIDRYMKQQNRLPNGHSEMHHPDEARKNKQDTEEKENVSTNGFHNHIEEQLKCKENEINELKTKFLKHRQILVSNYEQSESEVKRLDDIYHDTVESVLKAFSTIPEVVSAHTSLQQLKRNLEVSYSDENRIKNDFSGILKAENINANQSL